MPGRENTFRRIDFRNAVWQSDLPASAKLLALAYESWAGVDTREVWVTDEHLRKRTSFSHDTISRHRKTLVGLGWLQLVSAAMPGRCARYRLAIPRGHAPANDTADTISGVLDPEQVDGRLILRDEASDSAYEDSRRSDANSNHNKNQEQRVLPTLLVQSQREIDDYRTPSACDRNVPSGDEEAKIDARRAAIGDVVGALQTRWEES